MCALSHPLLCASVPLEPLWGRGVVSGQATGLNAGTDLLAQIESELNAKDCAVEGSAGEFGNDGSWQGALVGLFLLSASSFSGR